ncbi:hypothetical protein FQZ97_913280 [compost metagenome]
MPVLNGGGSDVGIRDIVRIKATLHDLFGQVTEFGQAFAHAVNGESGEEIPARLRPDVIHREVEQEIVVGFCTLQERLHPADIGKEGRCIFPDTVGGRHIHRCVKFPSRPGGILRRIGASVKVHVIYTGGEHLIDLRLTLAQRSTKMLGEPGEGFGRNKGLPRDIGG